MSQLLRIRWPKYWSFSFSIIPSEEHPGLISFRMDWLDLLAVQGTLKSLQHHSSLQSCLILCDPMNCNLPGSSVHGILQARILEWVAMPSSMGTTGYYKILSIVPCAIEYVLVAYLFYI